MTRIKGYMLSYGDVEFSHEGTDYLARYKSDAISGRSWVYEILNLGTDEEVNEDQAVEWRAGWSEPATAVTDEWKALHPLAVAAMQREIERRQDRALG